MTDLRKDPRLKDSLTLIKEMWDEKYSTLFNDNPFSGLEIVTDWLNEQLNIIRKDGTVSKILFKNNDLSEVLKRSIVEGDEFYSYLFDQGTWISKKSQDLRIDNPFSFAIERIYNVIWGIQNSSRSEELVIYGELQKHIETHFGTRTAHNGSINPQEWLKIHTITHGLWNFHNAWLSTIDVDVLRNVIHDLEAISSESKLHDLAELMNYRNEKEKYSQAYENNLVNLGQKSDWEYVREATRESDMLSFEENLGFKENLIFRCGLEHWIKWVDNLKWPVLQDHAFMFVKRIELYDQILKIIVDDKLGLKTDPKCMVLIALKNYYELIEDLSRNLFHLKKGDWNYNNTPEADDIIKNATDQYENWINNDLKKTCMKVFDIIFGSSVISTSRYFDGVFEWINSLSVQNFIGKVNEIPTTITLDTLNEAFQEKLIQDKGNKLNILQRVRTEKLNWEVFGKFMRLFENDPSDSRFGNALFEKYLDYLQSDNFRWSSGLNNFHNHNINMAHNLSILLKSIFPDSLSTWEELNDRFRCWHEGWKSPGFNDYEMRRKEAYVSTVGACLAYALYKENQTNLAQSIFERVLEVVLSQHRADSYSSEEYWFPLQLLALTLAQYNSSKVEEFVLLISNKVDSERGFLVTIYRLCTELKVKGIVLTVKSQEVIHDRTNDRFWIIESAYDDPSQKGHLEYYQSLKKIVLEDELK